jgi:hypothetical protein
MKQLDSISNTWLRSRVAIDGPSLAEMQQDIEKQPYPRVERTSAEVSMTMTDSTARLHTGEFLLA